MKTWMRFLPNSKKIRVSDFAKKDLSRIGTYTQREWGAAQKRKYLGQIKTAFKTIRRSPDIGMNRDDILKGLQSHPTHKHVIFYRETKNELIIIRILHENMVPEKHLKSEDNV